MVLRGVFAPELGAVLAAVLVGLAVLAVKSYVPGVLGTEAKTIYREGYQTCLSRSLQRANPKFTEDCSLYVIQVSATPDQPISFAIDPIPVAFALTSALSVFVLLLAFLQRRSRGVARRASAVLALFVGVASLIFELSPAWVREYQAWPPSNGHLLRGCPVTDCTGGPAVWNAVRPGHFAFESVDLAFITGQAALLVLAVFVLMAVTRWAWHSFSHE